MELIKDQYQKKNYEQVDDVHTLFTIHVKSQTWAGSPTASSCPTVTEYPEICIWND